MASQESFTTLLYRVDDKVAYITLNRPKHFNAINHEMPRELRNAVEKANADDRVHVIVLAGNGTAFCSGYDLKVISSNELLSS